MADALGPAGDLVQADVHLARGDTKALWGDVAGAVVGGGIAVGRANAIAAAPLTLGTSLGFAVGCYAAGWAGSQIAQMPFSWTCCPSVQAGGSEGRRRVRQVGVSLQRQALAKRLLTTTHVFGVLGVVLSAALLIMGMITGGLTVLAMTVLFWGGAVIATRAAAKRQV
ncbi:hypothetical protein [Streptomyces sp. NPDC002566]|uniref:hypothetical protein n=1 Tax=Streptomyces sp. NPDC002566 TaxID=3364650 RepID=UPI003673C478